MSFVFLGQTVTVIVVHLCHGQMKRCKRHRKDGDSFFLLFRKSIPLNQRHDIAEKKTVSQVCCKQNKSSGMWNISTEIITLKFHTVSSKNRKNVLTWDIKTWTFGNFFWPSTFLKVWLVLVLIPFSSLYSGLKSPGSRINEVSALSWISNSHYAPNSPSIHYLTRSVTLPRRSAGAFLGTHTTWQNQGIHPGKVVTHTPTPSTLTFSQFLQLVCVSGQWEETWRKPINTQRSSKSRPGFKLLLRDSSANHASTM